MELLPKIVTVVSGKTAAPSEGGKPTLLGGGRTPERNPLIDLLCSRLDAAHISAEQARQAGKGVAVTASTSLIGACGYKLPPLEN
jgi:hypothetical protein